MKSCFRALLTGLMMLTLAACGGGGSIERDTSGGTNTGGSTGGGTSTPSLTINLTITDDQGNASNALSADNPLVVTATVTDAEGNVAADELITFSFSVDNLAIFNTDSATALTNSSGVATIGLVVGDNSGDGLVIGTIGADSGQVGFTSDGTTQAVVQPFTLELFSDRSQLASSGSDEVELRALVKNEQNVLLEGVEVRFKANSEASIAVSQPITDADGIATAILRTVNKPENRIITATAEVFTQSETLVQNVEIAVVGTDINVNGPTSVIVNDVVPVTIILEDSDSNGIGNQEVTVTVLDGNGQVIANPDISDSSPITAANGQVTINFTSTSSGQFTIQANALSAQGSMDILVQQDQFGFVNPPDVNDSDEDIPLNQNATITIEWLKEGIAFANGQVSFNTSRGTIVSQDAVTDAQGRASFEIQSDNAGIASITAIGVDDESNEVSARVNIAFVATVADSIIVDATPDSIGPDGQRSTISAVVRDPTGNLVKNKVVTFEVEDVSTGFLSTGRSTTDKNGIATTVYESVSVSSVDSVRVIATVEDTPSVNNFVTLTVGDRAFDITIGTGRLIDSPTDSSYNKEFSIFVIDPDSNPVVNAELTFSAPPVKFSQGGVYRKGTWVWDPIDEIWDQFVTAICPNEDVNGNGILDEGEDNNGDGQLTPGNVVSVPSSATTDANGQALIEMGYAKQFGGWVDVRIKVSSESEGSESSESQFFALGVAGTDVIDEASPPPSSPYGVNNDCSSID